MSRRRGAQPLGALGAVAAAQAGADREQGGTDRGAVGRGRGGEPGVEALDGVGAADGRERRLGHRDRVGEGGEDRRLAWGQDLHGSSRASCAAASSAIVAAAASASPSATARAAAA